MGTITEEIYSIIFVILGEEKAGIRWVDLAKKIRERNSKLHPKTINGLIWKLAEKYPEKVYRTEDKLFRLVKFR